MSLIPLVSIPAGQFLMGSPDAENGRRDDEARAERSVLRPFWLGLTSITQAQYEAVTGLNPSHFQGDAALPVESLTWYEALVFCNALSEREGLTPAYRLEHRQDVLQDLVGEHGQESLEGTMTSVYQVTWNTEAAGYRLPTEIEWEYAARAGESWLYAGGDDADAVAVWRGNSGKFPQWRSQPVASKKANAWGLFDMSGLVSEWLWDAYSESAREAPSVAAPPSDIRVVRGGNYYSQRRELRVASRCFDGASLGWLPYLKSRMIGFRVARNQV